MGERPVYFSEDYSSSSYSDDSTGNFPRMFTYGQDVGYEITSFTYPGELVLNAGDTVVTLLDKIISTLGNYEYFYDLDGNFVFQEIKNYLNSGRLLLDLNPADYVRSYNNAKFLYSLTDLDTTTAITRNPKYDDVKNDFYVWGKRTTSTGVEVAIRYHLAIDDKPDIDLASKYMWKIEDKESNLIVRYDFNDSADGYTVDGYTATLISIPCNEWREELYRRALDAQVSNSIYDNYYDSELIAEWRNLYNPLNKSWNSTNHWNPNVYNDPGSINFWLDFIDTGSALGKYSIKNIGRRTKVVNSNDIKTVYNSRVPDVIFYQKSQYSSEEEQKLRDHYNSIGQPFFPSTDLFYNNISISTTGASCFDKIRELMYQNLCYNTTISLTCLPKYYIEPNNIIKIEDDDSNIYGNYQITQYSLPLTYNGTMSITATEVLTRV